MVAEILSGAQSGLALAVQFNPVSSLIGVVVAAVFATRSGRIRGAALVLCAAWFVGDGLRLVPYVSDVLAQSAAPVQAAMVASLVLWGVGGFSLGYVAPTVVGTYVGRRVTFGTGWLSAGAVAAAVSVALGVFPA